MTTLDIDAVEAFVLVAELRSFTRAAEVLDPTQSAVSARIRRLEDGLGRRLLERTPRQVRLSADGEAFLNAVIVLRHDNRRNDGEVLMNEAFAWHGTPDFVHRSDAPLPVALQAEPCSVRRMAVDALSFAGIAWSEA